MPRPRSYTYLLGDSATEASRLRAQARLWDPTAHALFDRLKIRRGATRARNRPRRRVAAPRAAAPRARGPVDAVEPSDGVRRPASRAWPAATGSAPDGCGAPTSRAWRCPRPLDERTTTHLRALGVPVPARSGGARAAARGRARDRAGCSRSRTTSARRCGMIPAAAPLGARSWPPTARSSSRQGGARQHRRAAAGALRSAPAWTWWTSTPTVQERPPGVAGVELAVGLLPRRRDRSAGRARRVHRPPTRGS